MKPEHWSHTKQAMIERCPKQYELRYEQGLKVPPDLPLLRGRAAHHAAEENYRRKPFYDGEDLPVEAVEDLARDDFVAALHAPHAIGASYGDRYDDPKAARGAAQDDAVTAARLYHERIGTQVQPVTYRAADQGDRLRTQVAAELRFEVPDSPVLPVPLVGVIDVVENVDGQHLIRDEKITGRTPERGAEHVSLQASFYELGYRAWRSRASAGQVFDHVVLKKSPEVVTRATARGEHELDQVVERIQLRVIQTEREIYPPTSPDNWWCSARWCGYYDSLCPFGRRARSDRPQT